MGPIMRATASTLLTEYFRMAPAPPLGSAASVSFDMLRMSGARRLSNRSCSLFREISPLRTTAPPLDGKRAIRTHASKSRVWSATVSQGWGGFQKLCVALGEELDGWLLDRALREDYWLAMQALNGVLEGRAIALFK